MNSKLAILVCLALFLGLAANPAVAITVENPGFELPPGGKQVGVEPNGWTVSGSDYGIEGVSCEGSQSLFLGKNNDGYQLTDHTITEGDVYTLRFEAFKTWPESPTATFEGWLYYKQGANRIQIASVSGSDSAMDCDEYQLSYTVLPGDSSIDRKLGILFTNTSTYGSGIWVGFDNVRLDLNNPLLADNPNPADVSENIIHDVILSWTPGPDANAHDVYLGTDSASVSSATTSSGEYMGRRDTNSYDVNGYDPCGLEFSTTYYWRVDGVNGPSSQDGEVWSFTVRAAGDFTCDGVADSNDLKALADDWLNSGYGIIIAEAYKDNTVNFKDYSILADTWHWGRYFVDSNDGNDNNSGTSPAEAWKSLSPVNSMTFMPGDKILFKADSNYTGQLKPQGSGAPGKPIIIDMYGDGNKPRIDGEGLFLETVLLENVEYYEVSNLEITNTGPTRVAGRKGVSVSAWSPALAVAHHIHLKNLYVHDVNGSNVKADGGGTGISIYCNGSDSRYDDILIEDCHLVRTDRNGIGFWNEYCYPWWHWNPSTNVVVRGNLLEDIGGDGIVPIGCDGALVEYNTLIGGRVRALDYAAGMWPWGCLNTTFQFNEVTGMVGTLDGQAFDCDYECGGTLFQYNYSHENDGGFMLVCAPGTNDYACRNSVIRYNISQNDGSNSRIFHISGKTINTKIYNNVIYSNLNNDLIEFGNWESGVPTDTQFYNNIFYITGQASYVWGTTSGTVFENNVFYGNHVGRPSDPYEITSDPNLVDPNSGGSGLDSVDGYMLTAGSPCIGAGQLITDNGGRDYWGNLVSDVNAPDVGAHQYSN
jgi:hypothetical protein